MKILILDRDEISLKLVTSKLSRGEYSIACETNKSQALERLASEIFDVIMLDPSPLTDINAAVISIKRAARSFPYIVVLGENLDTQKVIRSGANNYLEKPADPERFIQIIEQAKGLQTYSTRLADTSEDFPSAGGVIAKSAFNQLFLSGLDRSWRYDEKSHILSVTIDNYDEIRKLDGDYHAVYGASKLAYHIVRLRRQSDIVGQTGVNEFSLLLQRSTKDNEAEEAAKRFSQNIAEINDFIPPEGSALRIRVHLIELPTGNIVYTQTIIKKP